MYEALKDNENNIKNEDKTELETEVSNIIDENKGNKNKIETHKIKNVVKRTLELNLTRKIEDKIIQKNDKRYESFTCEKIRIM